MVLYHLQGPLQLSIGRKPCFAQLYFFDPSYAAQVYTTVDINLREGLLKSLMQELRMENPLHEGTTSFTVRETYSGYY